MFAYFLRRLAPFYFLFTLIQSATRLVLAVVAWPQLGHAWRGLAKAMVHGALFDLAVFSYFAIPIALVLLAIPQRRQCARTDIWISSCLMFLLAFDWFGTAVAEWLFWDEFSTRFNFIAVDYLVYTREVVGNIRESYPIYPLVGAVTGLSLLCAWLHARYVRALSREARQFPNPMKRFGYALATIGASILFFFALSSDQGTIDANQYVNELGRDGTYELFAAFRNNELKYDRFYVTGNQEKLLAQLRGELLAPGENFTDEQLTRHIPGAGAEIHPNVIFITVESLSASYLTIFGSKDGVTPNLDKLEDQSLFFTDLYANGTRTVYGLSALTLGMPPLPGNSIVRRQDNGGLFTLGSVLRGKGYETKFIYGGYGYFDNMNAFFSNNGYQIVDRATLAPAEITFANVWGVCDEDLFRRVLKESDASYAAGKPFYNMVMTTSNHRPFTFPAGRIDLPSKTSGRLGGVKYTDYAIARLLAEAKTKPWFANTIFVIVADHTAGSAGKTEIDPHGYHIPAFIYAPGLVKPQKIDKLASQIDLLPTLLGLMNMSYDSRFYGADLLRETPDRAFISNYQQLGFLTPGELLVLKPVKQIDRFTRHGDDYVANKEKSGVPAIDRALSYYQTATNWREWSRDLAH